MAVALPSPSIFENLPKFHKSDRLRIIQAYNNDEDPKKVCLFSNEYRDESENPFLLPVVTKCMKTIAGRDLSNVKDLLSFCDLDEYARLTCELMFGENSKVIQENRCLAINTVSNSGAVAIGAEFLRKQGYTNFVVESPYSIADYANTFKTAGFLKQHNFRLPEVSVRDSRYKNMITDLENAPPKSVVIFRMCGLDTTGLDPTPAEWEMILRIIKENEMFPFFDANYHGLLSGDTDVDAWPVRYFIAKGMEFFVAQSYSL